MRIYQVRFKSDVKIASMEARSQFESKEPGKQDAQRPIAPSPGISLHLIAGGSLVLVQSYGTSPEKTGAVLLPVTQVEWMWPWGAKGPHGYHVPDEKQLKELVSDKLD
jgi:hypothetical protein